MSTEDLYRNGKIAVAVRTARTAIGWNQQEFADMMGVAKSTVARIETMEMAARGDFLIKAIQLFREVGIEVDLSDPRSLPLQIGESAIETAIKALGDESKRRSDKRSGIAGLLPRDEEQ